MPTIARMIECYVPIYACNMKCQYCYIKQNEGRSFEKQVDKFPFSPSVMAYALRKERLGGVCLINLCAGGETLLSDETVELAHLLLKEGHYVMIVTNGSPRKAFQALCDFPTEYKRRLWVRFSLHYLECKRLNLLGRFFEHVNQIKKAGMSIAVEMVASDEYIPYIEEIKTICIEEIGSYPEISIARDEKDFSTLTALSDKAFKETWKTFQSPSFDFKLQTVGVKRKEFCYAGEWTATLDLSTGNISKCYDKPFANIFEDCDASIPFEAMGNACPLPYCHNAHIWLTLGNIPSLHHLPTFAAIRNKRCVDGTQWLTPEMERFIDGKWIDHHSPYTWLQKKRVNIKGSIVRNTDQWKRKTIRIAVKVKRGLQR